MTALWETMEGFTATHLLQKAAELSLGITPIEMGARSMNERLFSGRLLMREVQPGLIASSSDLTYFASQHLTLEADAGLSCSILLEGYPERIRIDQQDWVSKCLERAVLIGHRQRVTCVRPRIDQPRRSCEAGFMLKPSFFDRFSQYVSDDGLAVLWDFMSADYRTVTLAYSPRLLAIARHMLECPYLGQLGELFLESNTVALVAEVAAQLGQERKHMPIMGKRRYDQVAMARHILDARIVSPPSTLALAQQVGVNITSLQKNFRRVFGTTIFGYVRDQRLMMARMLLRDHDLLAAEVGRKVGFSSAAAFTTAYKRRFGRSPTLDRRPSRRTHVG